MPQITPEQKSSASKPSETFQNRWEHLETSQNTPEHQLKHLKTSKSYTETLRTTENASENSSTSGNTSKHSAIFQNRLNLWRRYKMLQIPSKRQKNA